MALMTVEVIQRAVSDISLVLMAVSCFRLSAGPAAKYPCKFPAFNQQRLTRHLSVSTEAAFFRNESKEAFSAE